MKVAIVMTVKNEVRLLRQNVLYHLGIGARKIFVYFDQTTDGGEKTLLDLKEVEMNASVHTETYQHIPYLKKFWSNSKEHHTARQCLNTYDAMQKCKAEQIDWLISLDADELFLSSPDGSRSLEEFFKEASRQEADIINLKPLEIIARKMIYQNVMLEETLFKTQKNFQSKFDQLYQKIEDPYTKTYNSVSYWRGHTMGKAAIRVSAEIIPQNVHRYTSINGKELITMDKGNVLHYHIYDFEDFIKKFKNFETRSDTFLSGNKIEYLKRLWIKLVNDSTYSRTELETYFEQNLLFSPSKLKTLQRTRFWNIFKRRESALVSINVPKRILSNMNTKIHL